MLNYLLQQMQALAGPYYDFSLAAVIILVSLVAAKVVRALFERLIDKWTKKTSNVLDDMLVAALGKPVFFLVFLAGIYLALGALSAYNPYSLYMEEAFTAIFALYSAFIAVRIINTFIVWHATESAKAKKADVNKQFVSMARKVVYLIVFAIALVWMLNQLGIEVTTLVATLGIGGLAIALALQPTLSNFFSGTYLMMDKPIRIGDYIELDSGEKGYIDEISWRSTRIRTIGNNYVIIPNSKLAESKITNYFYPRKEMSVIIKCGVSYDSDLEKVEKVTVQVAKQVLKKSEGVVKGFDPFIRYNEFGDNNINFSIILRVNEYVNKYKLTHEFIKALKKRYDREKIEISWPVRKVYMAK